MRTPIPNNVRKRRENGVNSMHSNIRDNKRNVEWFLKGLGHAILGNFRADRMVIELTKILK